MVARAVAVLALASGLVAGAASAGEATEAQAAGPQVNGAQGPVRELTHQVSLELRRGYAVWEAERSVDSDDAGQAFVDVQLPQTDDLDSRKAVPVGLSIKQRKGWLDGSLMATVDARERYQEGGGTDPAAALLELGDEDGLARLSISGLSERARRTVRYRVLVPMRYEDGRYVMRIPPRPAGLAPVIVPKSPDGRITLNGRRVSAGHGFRVDAAKDTVIALHPRRDPAAAPLDGSLTVVPFGDQFLTHARLEVQPQLSERPVDARLVFLVDTSRSVDDAMVARQIAAVVAVLASMPSAKADVVAFNRASEPRFGRFVPSALAQRSLEQWKPDRANGTELVAAIKSAAEQLATQPAGPKRIVVFSDGLLPSHAPIQALTDELPADLAVMHLVKVARNSGAPSLMRDTGSAWEQAAARTGGVAWFANAVAGREHRDAMERSFVRLARPTVLDELSLASSPWLDTGPLCAPFELAEGAGTSLLALADQPLPWIRVKAKLWQENVEVTLPSAEQEGSVWAALAFGTFVLPFDDERALLDLAQRGGAVTHLTSYVAGRTVAPPPIPNADSTFGQLSRRVRTSACGGVVSGRHPGNRKQWLENQLRVAWFDCGGALHSAAITLETARGEIQAVAAPTLSAAAPKKMGPCLREAAWQVELADMFVDDEPRQWSLDVRPIFR
jgi:von Willebrand factor type A domain